MKGGVCLLDSIDYYNKYSKIYFENTVNLNMTPILNRFLSLLPDGASILDLGCGAGRDAAYMLEHDYDVTLLDGSEEMCALAEIHTDHEVLNMKFEDLDFDEVFDGVWACASLLHVEQSEMPYILGKIREALVPQGIFYMSVKKGDFQGYRNERFFADFKKHELKDLFAKVRGFEILDIWQTEDVRSNKSEQAWLNVLAKKVEIE